MYADILVTLLECFYWLIFLFFLLMKDTKLKSIKCLLTLDHFNKNMVAFQSWKNEMSLGKLFVDLLKKWFSVQTLSVSTCRCTVGQIQSSIHADGKTGEFCSVVLWTANCTTIITLHQHDWIFIFRWTVFPVLTSRCTNEVTEHSSNI